MKNPSAEVHDTNKIIYSTSEDMSCNKKYTSAKINDFNARV